MDVAPAVVGRNPGDWQGDTTPWSCLLAGLSGAGPNFVKAAYRVLPRILISVSAMVRAISACPDWLG